MMRAPSPTPAACALSPASPASSSRPANAAARSGTALTPSSAAIIAGTNHAGLCSRACTIGPITDVISADGQPAPAAGRLYPKKAASRDTVLCTLFFTSISHRSWPPPGRRYVHLECLRRWQASVYRVGGACDPRAYKCAVCQARYTHQPITHHGPWGGTAFLVLRGILGACHRQYNSTCLEMRAA